MIRFSVRLDSQYKLKRFGKVLELKTYVAGIPTGDKYEAGHSVNINYSEGYSTFTHRHRGDRGRGGGRGEGGLNRASPL